MTSSCWLVVMDSKRFARPIMGIFCGGLNAYCMQTRPLFLRTSGSSGVLKAFLLERNGQLSCNPKKTLSHYSSNWDDSLSSELKAMQVQAAESRTDFDARLAR